jgi:hypothetical protein
MVKGKFRVSSVSNVGASKRVKLAAVADDTIPEGQRYHKAAPTGSIEITVDNPLVAEQFTSGKEFSVELTPASE